MPVWPLDLLDGGDLELDGYCVALLEGPRRQVVLRLAAALLLSAALHVPHAALIVLQATL